MVRDKILSTLQMLLEIFKTIESFLLPCFNGVLVIRRLVGGRGDQWPEPVYRMNFVVCGTSNRCILWEKRKEKKIHTIEQLSAETPDWPNWPMK